MKAFLSPRSRNLIVSSLLGGLTACAASPTPQEAPPVATEQPPAAAPPPLSRTVPSVPPFETSGRADFDTWRADFARRALQDGRDPTVVYDVLRDLKPLEIYLPSDTRSVQPQSDVSEQAEFAKPIWDYVGSAVSDSRRTNGRAKAAQLAGLLSSIEVELDVDAEAVAAIWGMETSYGSYIGDFDGPETLANMAVEGRRRTFAENELLATMVLIERGYATREELQAGWAGAMGQTQFMPSTYLAHAVDFDGDGRRDVWRSEADALGSAANYLASIGYVSGEPWGAEVIVPDNFNFAFANGDKRSVVEWRDLGLYPMPGAALPSDPFAEARLWLPAGARGPKYLLFRNFDVFLSYNRANAYAFSVGLLADAIAGRPGPQTPWPTDVRPLSVSDVKILQAQLNRMGFDAGAVDGIAGSGTRRALQRFQVSRGMVADGYPTEAALSALLASAQPGISALGASPG
ncbi:MAG: lytic murein transglycosylase [Pseudomonadota bacterium]